MRKISVLMLSVCMGLCPLFCLGQQDISTDLVYKVESGFEFTDEWQYLSTDMYLFNTQQFGFLINELIFDKKSHKKENKYLEYLCITATLKDIRYFDNQDIVYPIYNFQIDRDKNKNYSTHISRTREVVRLIDNLPLASTEGTVEAEIVAKAITNHKRTEIFDMISSQLITISKLVNPTGAVMSLVGEFGNFLKSTAPSGSGESFKRNFEFSSTIRLYEGDNFNQRLHSIRVFVFLPDGRKVRFDARELSRQIEADPDLPLDRPTLDRLIRFKEYPYLVVVNYKSRYQMPVVVGDEVNNEMIQSRQDQVEDDYKMELINDATYAQEREFIEFLKEFAALKNQIKNYTLAYQAGSGTNISRPLFEIIQSYYELKHILLSRDREYHEDPTYQNVFREKYQSITRNAELYLDKDYNLKSSRALVQTLLALDKLRTPKLDSTQREKYLETLYTANLPDLEFLGKTVVGQEVLRKTKLLEEAHYRNVFQNDCSYLAGLQANEQSMPERNDLLNRVNRSNCVSCKKKVEQAIKSYDDRYRNYKLGQMLAKKDTLIRESEDRIFEFLIKKDCISANIKAYAEEKPSYLKRLEQRFGETNDKLLEFDRMISASDALDVKDPAAVKDYTEKLGKLGLDVHYGYTDICEKMPKLCECN